MEENNMNEKFEKNILGEINEKTGKHFENTGIHVTPISTGQGSFRLSEEDAERVRASAMQNSNNNLTQEIKKSMESSSTYNNSEIPENIHNAIALDEAKHKKAHYREESTKFTDSIISDNATKEILDEVEATTKLSSMDFGNIDEYLNQLSQLSFLEAISLRKKVDTEIASWKSCRASIDAIAQLKLDDNINREIMQNNTMSEYDIDTTVEDFDKCYEGNLDKLNRIAETLGKIITEHKSEINSTSFLTNEMVSLMQKKVAKLDPAAQNYEFNKIRMERVIRAFQNRMSLVYIHDKLETFLKTNKKYIKKRFRDDKSKIQSYQRTKPINELVRFFNNDMIYNLYETLANIFMKDYDKVYLMLVFLAKVMNTEKSTGNNAWIKVFILNISDINGGIFDIGNSEEYFENFDHIITPVIDEYFTKNVVTLDILASNFGLAYPNNTKDDSIEEKNIN